MATPRKRPESIEADAVAWARAQRRNVRSCETCMWLRRNPRAARWLGAVLSERKAKRSVVANRTIAAFLTETFKYPLSSSAFRNHLLVGHDGA